MPKKPLNVPCSTCSTGTVVRNRYRQYQCLPVCKACRRKRHDGYNANANGVCKTCGVRFTQKRDKIFYCSNDCRYNKPAAIWHWCCRIDIRQCQWCSVPFVSRSGRGDHCSTECRRLCRRPPVSRIRINPCQQCGRLFTSNAYFNPRKYCTACRLLRGHIAKQDYRKGRAKVSKIVDYIGDRDRWKCHICQRKVSKASYDGKNRWSKTVDHVIPASLGGSDDPSNLRLAHACCNASRGNRGGGEQLMLVG